MHSDAPSTDHRGLLDSSPMSLAQIIAVLVTLLISSIEGYDVLSMSFVAPAISHDWGINRVTLGTVLSSGLVGMVFGSLCLAPLADFVGRKPIVLTGVLVVTAGSALSAFCRSALELAACRVLTGLGIGMLVAVISSLAAEFTNARRRSLTVVMVAVGYPIGVVVGGIASALLLRRRGWPWVFICGGVASGLLVPVITLWLPESPAYLIERRPKNALQKLNAVMRRFGHRPVTALPEMSALKQASYGALFAPGMTTTTGRLTLVNLLVSMAANFVLTWMPQMAADAGLSPSAGSLVSATASLVGIVSGLIQAAMVAYIRPSRLSGAAMIGLGVAITAYGFCPPSLPLFMLAAAGCGVCLFGATAVFSATIVASFAPIMRATGAGFITGVGRIASAAGPYIAGTLFVVGLKRGQVSLIFACATIIGGLILVAAPPRQADAAVVS